MPHHFDTALAIIDRAIAAHATPGAQLSVRWREGTEWFAFDAARGTLDYGDAAQPATVETRYDYASVSKAIVALALIRMASRGVVDLTAHLGDVLPLAHGRPAQDVTLEQLAAHRSELPAWYPFFQAVEPREAERGGTRERVLNDVAMSVLEPNGGHARYSDVGYILLGAAMEAITGQSLDRIVRDEVTAPLELDDEIAYRGVGESFRDVTVAPTEWCAWRNRVVQGNVHDENCYALEGRAGHAGLFGTARALAMIGQASLQSLAGDARWFDPRWMAKMAAPRAGGSHRLGWDGKSGEGSSAGTRMSSATFGHLGFTGTSLWCDPEAGIAVALVTNRVHPSRENGGIRALRVAVHDAVAGAVRG